MLSLIFGTFFLIIAFAFGLLGAAWERFKGLNRNFFSPRFALIPIQSLFFWILLLILTEPFCEPFMPTGMFLGNGWVCRLASGDSSMIDSGDYCAIQNENSTEQTLFEHRIVGVRKLQLERGYVFGAADSRIADWNSRDSDKVDTYFVLESASGTIGKFSSEEILKQEARKKGLELRLGFIYEVYREREDIPVWRVYLNLIAFALSVTIAICRCRGWRLGLKLPWATEAPPSLFSN